MGLAGALSCHSVSVRRQHDRTVIKVSSMPSSKITMGLRPRRRQASRSRAMGEKQTFTGRVQHTAGPDGGRQPLGFVSMAAGRFGSIESSRRSR